jgi:hypothetical protein
MPIYFEKSILDELNLERRKIYLIRTKAYKKYSIDLLDTDILSSLSLFEIVHKYDQNFNINLARNGEDARSLDIPIELKTCCTKERYTKKGNLKKNADRDGAFAFHAMGDIEHKRYIFAAKNKTDLSIERMYDISDSHNCSLINERLASKKDAWLKKVNGDQKKMKYDLILIEESFILDNISFCNEFIIEDCKIFTDVEKYYYEAS